MYLPTDARKEKLKGLKDILQQIIYVNSTLLSLFIEFVIFISFKRRTRIYLDFYNAKYDLQVIHDNSDGLLVM